MEASNLPYKNTALIIGKLISCRKVHEQLGAAFYDLTLRVNRLTDGKHDDIVIYAPQWALPGRIAISDTLRVVGEVRTYKNLNSLWQSKCIKVYTKKITIVDANVPHTNRVELIGNLSKVGKKRNIPITNKVMTDFSVVVYRTEGYSKGERSDFINCVAWGNEIFAKLNHSVSKKIRIIGRIQERTFEKRHSNDTVTKETVHEISCASIEIL